MKFNERLKELINENSINYNLLSKKTGIPVTTLSNYINRGSIPTATQLSILADYFECSVDYLIGREDDLGIVKIVDSNNSLNAKERELVDNYRKLNALEQDAIMLQTKALANKK